MEVERILHLLDGRKIASGTEFWITTNRAVYGWLEQTGRLRPLKASGVKVMTDSCIFAGNYQNYWGFKTAATIACTA